MAILSSVPPEILHNMMYQMQPDDLENLVLASKQIYFTSVPVLGEHRELKRRYTVISHVAKVPAGCSVHHSEQLSPVHQLPDLLKAIINCPRIGLYIRKIIVRGIENEWVTDSNLNYNDSGFDIVLNPPCAEDDLELFERTASQIPVLSPLDRQLPSLNGWYNDFNKGRHGAVLGLIMLHCPNLSTFDFEDRGGYTRAIFDLFKLINTDKGRGCLGRLKDVRFEHLQWGEEVSHEDINRIKTLLSLPAMESLEAHHLGRVFYDVIGSPMPYRSSNIQSLTLTHCPIRNESFFELLEAIGRLKSLTLRKTSLRSAWIRAALIAFAVDSLEYLSLHANVAEVDGEPFYYMGRLKPFTALRIVDIDDVMLEDYEIGEVRDLEAHLPTSLQSLKLSKFYYLKEDYIEGLKSELQLMMKANAGRRIFPDLKQINLIDVLPVEADDESGQNEAEKKGDRNEGEENRLTLRNLHEGFGRQGVELQVKSIHA
ncbi:MAG: hypothetical protein Q9192_001705 [Flavoplaca navasiana]